MPLQIYPLKQFLVRPAIPQALSRLPELGLNLMWSWNHSIRALFRRLDSAAWKGSGYNPVLMLGRVPQETFDRAAADPRFLSLYKSACTLIDNYLSAPSPAPGMMVAYFSMEYGLVDCLHIYSGGLGVLSGDHLKAASDAQIPLTGVGLFYQNGYLKQTISADGTQEELPTVNDFYSLPATPETRADGSELLIDVELAGTTVYFKVWRVDVGRVRLYLLDSNIPQNPSQEHRIITNRLYGGDHHQRIRQEIALGIGGLRALRELGIHPTVFHMNEGHSAFLAVERIRVLMAEQGLSFVEALEASRPNNVFTTHTSVPAGIDIFPEDLLREYFQGYCDGAGIAFFDFLSLGRPSPSASSGPYSMAVSAFKTSAYRNAVSKLHRTVSQKMWEDLWPQLLTHEIPIASITNGVHLPSWVTGELATVYDQYLEPEWREGNAGQDVWRHIADVPPAEIWEAHRRRKRRMVAFIRDRASSAAAARKAPLSEIRRLSEIFDPEALTIGFARRFATYKRATLLFRDPERLKAILCDPKRPVQVVVAGKAHPQDVPGKALIREIVHRSHEEGLDARVVFVEDYGIEVARELVGGVDLWLNTPMRGEEACGTSGMKAGLNGVLNFSVLDGWFDEAGEESAGWPIGGREVYSPERDDAHAAGLYQTLEDEIVPLYYEGREQGVPVQWMRRVKKSLEYLSRNFNCQRMVEEYGTLFYGPAHAHHERDRQDGYRAPRERVHWTRFVAEKWSGVRFVEVNADGGDGVGEGAASGSPMRIRARLNLAGLDPSDVLVEAVVGRVGSEGELTDPAVIPLAPTGERHQEVVVFQTEFTPSVTGRLGFTARVSPNHSPEPLARPCHAPMLWA